ncbi:MAG: phospholipid carrier-dependent glycosyltransferase [Candidatus Dormibacter sp.]|uniref:phospholipid carrier-dependent glycosyltransferase n=1 Tax=Candidatus Dormibacter sp. TaxID=2973982 RepID=UPI000DB5C1B0|nr:MAG: hypothetical protein DLM66_12440 [Candidatus Dormibacteraeota bacterium]
MSGRGGAAADRSAVPATEAPASAGIAPLSAAFDSGGNRLLRWLGLAGADVLLLGGLFLVAFVLRAFSPLMPDVLTGHLDRPPVSNCVHGTPVDATSQPGTLCGLSYPYQRNTQAAGLPASPPEGEVFDEIYFGVFAHNDLKGIAYFDPEPPLAKEVIAAGELLDGWWLKTFGGGQGDYADLGFNPVGWRLASLAFGTLCVPLMYLLALQLWRDRRFAFAAGFLTCFDGMFFVQSRIGMIDIIPIFLILLAYTLFALHLRSRSRRESYATLVATGAVCGLAISAKWIALATLASIVLLLLVRGIASLVGAEGNRGQGRWRLGRLTLPYLPGRASTPRYVLLSGFAFLVLPLGIYLLSWLPFFTRGQFHSLTDLITYQQQIFQYHATLTATHPYGSKWYSWPFLYRPVAYYYEYKGLGLDQASGQPLVAGIINLGNPFIWWASLPALLLLPYYLIRERSWAAAVILLGFLTQYLPWARITRVLFLYHMFGGLIFMVLALAFVLARLSRQPGRRWLLPAYLTVAGLGFAYFYPAWTGLPISYPAYFSGFPAGKMWFPSWI